MKATVSRSDGIKIANRKQSELAKLVVFTSPIDSDNDNDDDDDIEMA